MSYLKIENNQIVEAPFICKRNGKIIHGYNKSVNEAMLFEDGYQKFIKGPFNYQIVSRTNNWKGKWIKPKTWKYCIY